MDLVENVLQGIGLWEKRKPAPSQNSSRNVLGVAKYSMDPALNIRRIQAIAMQAAYKRAAYSCSCIAARSAALYDSKCWVSGWEEPGKLWMFPCTAGEHHSLSRSYLGSELRGF
jgi:hypothetical protein